jgi:hypothetical protein
MIKEEDKQYFEAMEALFTSQGWQLFKDDIKGWQDAIASQWRVLKPEQLQFEQGRAAALDQVLKHFELCESLRHEALDDDNTEDTDV